MEMMGLKETFGGCRDEIREVLDSIRRIVRLIR